MPQRLTAPRFGRRVAEDQVPVAILRGFIALGTPITEVLGQVCPGKKGTAPYHITRFVQRNRGTSDRMIEVGRCHRIGK